tara:strand:+ start:1268 stop:1468 length:201 start_codon:yes stop_codon:yes gene_type:complete
MTSVERDFIKRLKLVIEDANVIIEHLEQEKKLMDDTKNGVSVYTHLDNISIALDLNSYEHLTWKIS